MGQSGPSCEELQGTSSSSSDRWGTLASTRWPFGARPRGRVIFVLAHVSSMKTSRFRLRSGCSRCNSSRLSAVTHAPGNFANDVEYQVHSSIDLARSAMPVISVLTCSENIFPQQSISLASERLPPLGGFWEGLRRR